MMLLFLCFIIGSITVSLFSISLRINAINRAFINTPKEIFESSIPLTLSNEDEPYFSRDKLKAKLNSYYESTIKKYTSSYDLTYYFYNKEDHSYDDKHFSAVEITLKAQIIFSNEIEKTIFYEIRKGNVYGR